jgi:hypothetical protein
LDATSQGTAANGCYCAVIDVEISSPPADSHPALDTKILTPTVYGETPVRKLQLSRTAFRPQNLLFYNNHLSTLTLGNPTVISLHVPTNLQHVSLIMLSKSNHVATVVAITNLLLQVELVLTFYVLISGMLKALNVHSYNPLTSQDSIGPGLNWFLQMKPRNKLIS